MSPLRIAIVGFGKIARDRHVPAITATEGVALAAVADPQCLARRCAACRDPRSAVA